LQRGLCFALPRADAVLGPWRAVHDWTAREGLETHVSFRVPIPADVEITPAAIQLLADLLPVRVTLTRLEDRPGALVALAEPDDELRHITAQLDGIRGLPPHRNGRPDLAYHATIVRTDDPEVRRRAIDDIASQLPLTETTDELCLFEWSARDYLRVVWRFAPRLVH
jgi:hypothetical protein